MAEDVSHLLEAFDNLRVWRRGDQRAPHKPLLVLLALGRARRGLPRLAPFSELEPELRELLADFGPPRPPHPEYPFWHLQTDGVWEVAGAASLGRNPADTPSLRLARELDGGFPASVWQRVTTDEVLVREIAACLLDAHFPPSLHDDLTERVGLDDVWHVVTRPGPRRHPAFRVEVLRAYGYRCAVCGYDGRLDNLSVGLDAAHVRWWAAGGPDDVSNGLALCVMHHKAFDLGVIGLTADLRVRVSGAFHGGRSAHQFVTEFNGRALHQPQSGAVHDAHRQWHDREVFRGPARVGGFMAAEQPAAYSDTGRRGET